MVLYKSFFVTCFLLSMSRLRKNRGGMCDTTKSETVMKTNPSQIFRVILSAG
jgi:hypothetical protein